MKRKTLCGLQYWNDISNTKREATRGLQHLVKYKENFLPTWLT